MPAGSCFADLPAFGTLREGEHVSVGSHRLAMRRTGDAKLVVAADQSDVDRAVADLRVAFLLISLGGWRRR